MKVYRCRKNDADLGTLLSWHSSARQASRELRRHQKARGGAPCGPEGVELVDVPTDKAGLLTWLNINVDTDNG